MLKFVQFLEDLTQQEVELGPDEAAGWWIGTAKRHFTWGTFRKTVH